MRALILAAGAGNRLRPLTVDRPKALVELNGRSLLERQRQVLASAGIAPVAIVTGHGAAAVPMHGIARFHNPRWHETNMVHSLFCARDFFDSGDDLLIVYGDIVFERRMLDAVLDAAGPIALSSDRNWLRYWSQRTDAVLDDAESFRLDGAGRIRELGRRAERVEDIEGQFIGLVRIAAAALEPVTRFYDDLARRDPAGAGSMFMTDFIQRLIDAGWPVAAAPCDGGWLELDTLDDFALYERLAARGELGAFYRDY